MVDNKLSRGITEVLKILKQMDNVYTEKLLKKFMNFLQDNKDISCVPEIDDIQEYDISKEAKILLGIMYLKYWSNKVCFMNGLIRKKF